ncbi:MAG: nuclear transport factor 2 family protein [Bacteroidia bacterium]|nr:nuclear transport factor 2 family protein [Bacteroidia bacterium]MBT8267855.1 nuclear transport factor 2 family protein [Bacteroidia bacterium]NNK69334.1 hypothetical protein [Flavobacteriaceae bacterium]
MKINRLIIPILFFSLGISAQEKSNDLELITETIENYFYGYVERDGDRLHKAFDLDNGAMKLARKADDGTQYVANIPFKDLVPNWANKEKLSEAELKDCALKILSVDAVDGKIASAKISMKVGETTYIDILSMHKLSDQWKIVNKIFVVANN